MTIEVLRASARLLLMRFTGIQNRFFRQAGMDTNLFHRIDQAKVEIDGLSKQIYRGTEIQKCSFPLD